MKNHIAVPCRPVLAFRRRGVTTMLGLIALTALLTVMCSIVLDRSFETYHSSNSLVWRLQARAAAEGAAAMLAADWDRQNRRLSRDGLRLGDAAVEVGAAGERSGQRLVPLAVAIRRPGAARDQFSARFTARFIKAGAGWRLRRVEE